MSLSVSRKYSRTFTQGKRVVRVGVHFSNSGEHYRIKLYGQWFALPFVEALPQQPSHSRETFCGDNTTNWRMGEGYVSGMRNIAVDETDARKTLKIFSSYETHRFFTMWVRCSRWPSSNEMSARGLVVFERRGRFRLGRCRADHADRAVRELCKMTRRLLRARGY